MLIFNHKIKQNLHLLEMKKTFELLLLILFHKSKNIFKFKSLKVRRAKLDTLNFFLFSNSNIKQLLTIMDFCSRSFQEHFRAYFIIFAINFLPFLFITQTCLFSNQFCICQEAFTRLIGDPKSIFDYLISSHTRFKYLI